MEEDYTYTSKVVEAFQNALEALIEQYSQEWDIPMASLIGVLQVQSYDLCRLACGHIGLSEEDFEVEEEEEIDGDEWKTHGQE